MTGHASRVLYHIHVIRSGGYSRSSQFMRKQEADRMIAEATADIMTVGVVVEERCGFRRVSHSVGVMS